MVKCKVCGSEMTVDTSNVLLSSPPRYKAFCENCGNVSYVTWEQRMKVVDPAEAIPIKWIEQWERDYINANPIDRMFGAHTAIVYMLEDWRKENDQLQ